MVCHFTTDKALASILQLKQKGPPIDVSLCFDPKPFHLAQIVEILSQYEYLFAFTAVYFFGYPTELSGYLCN